MNQQLVRDEAASHGRVNELDEASPLWRLRNDVGKVLDGVEVSVSAFDMASLQQVMFFKRCASPHPHTVPALWPHPHTVPALWPCPAFAWPHL